MTERTADEDAALEDDFADAVGDLRATATGETRLLAEDDLETVLLKVAQLRLALDRVDRCYAAVMADGEVRCPTCRGREVHLFDPPAGWECHNCGREFEQSDAVAPIVVPPMPDLAPRNRRSSR